MIELKGCGQITKWRFPKDAKDCPALRCGFSFSTHSAARNHYKNVHAKHTICCPACEKPIVAANFQKHYKRLHPELQMPFKFEQAAGSSTRNDDVPALSVDDANEKDDVITLSGCGRITKWCVPADLMKCPVLNCQQHFDSRSAFLKHYEKRHAHKSIMCEVCAKPLILSGPREYETHFQRVHPNERVPIFDQKRKRNGKFIHSKSMVCNS